MGVTERELSKVEILEHLLEETSLSKIDPDKFGLGPFLEDTLCSYFSCYVLAKLL